MTAKEIIDEHFKNRYDYYRKICLNVTGNDKEVFEDLLHLSYFEFLKVKEQTILCFNKIDKLNYIGIKIIKRECLKRYNKKKYTKNLSSPLFRAADNFFRIDLCNEFELPEQLDETKYKEEDYLALDKAINELLQDPSKTVGVTIFLQANEVSINKLHRDSGISRYYLTHKYNEGLNNLKNHIQNEYKKTSTGNLSSHRSEPGAIQILDKTKREASVRV